MKRKWRSAFLSVSPLKWYVGCCANPLAGAVRNKYNAEELINSTREKGPLPTKNKMLIMNIRLENVQLPL